MTLPVLVARAEQRHSASRFLSSLRCNIALQDIALWVMLARLNYVALKHTHTTPWAVLGLLGLATLTIGSVRGGLLEEGPGRALIYRTGMFACVAGSYFALRPVLRALSPELVDGQLVRIDEILFGCTPAVWLDRFVSYGTVEWFAFFYYSFYLLLAGAVLGTIVFDSGRRRYELLLSVVTVISVGYMGYTVVPGVGPHACPGLHFEHVLQGGVWWGRVESAVRAAGAQYDIFPSLHTAQSVAIAAHAVRHRRSGIYRYVWGVVCVWTLNIVVATVFLRWHYGIDVLAGLALALASQRVAIRLWEREEGQARAQTREQPVWEVLLPDHMAQEDRRFVMGIFAIQVLVCFALVITG